MQVFLSYRRGDAGGYTGRLADALRARLGGRSVFQDVTAIAPGQDFTEAIDRTLDRSEAVLAIIGPGWLAASTPSGAARLFLPDDFVRLELARALDRNLRVVPILVGGASLPTAGQLPDDLRGLVNRQAVVLHDETWHEDVEGLVRSLRGEPPVPASRSRQRLLAGAVAGGLLVLAIAGTTALWWRQGGGQAGTEVPPCTPPNGSAWTEIALNRAPTGETKAANGALRFTVRDARARPWEGKWQVMLATSMENATTEHQYHGEYRYKSLVVGQREFRLSCFSPNPDLVTPRTVGDALVGFDVRCQPVGYMELVLEDDRISVTDDSLEPGPC